MFDRMMFARSCRGLIGAVVVVLGVVNIGCASNTQHKPVKAVDVKSDEKSQAQECQRVSNEAIRLRNGAVSAYNSGRRDAALLLFDQSIDAWRQVTNGALRCPLDIMTSANEQLDAAMRERNEMSRSAR
jgi:hypothetical protein